MGFNNTSRVSSDLSIEISFESYNRGEILSREDHVAIW